VFQIRGGQLRQITHQHTIGVLAWSADWLALVLAGTWTAGQTVDMDLWAGGRYLLSTGGLGPVADDRPHFNVFIFPLFPLSCRDSWPPWPPTGQRVPVDSVPLGRGPASGPSRLPSPASC